MTATVTTYVIYLGISVALTLWVGRTLAANGRPFLVDVFAGDERRADTVNRLLVVGFYLLNLGFVSLFLRIGGEVDGVRGVVEALSVKVGTVLLVLGTVHLINVYAFSRVRRRTVLAREHPPVEPNAWAPPRQEVRS